MPAPTDNLIQNGLQWLVGNGYDVATLSVLGVLALFLCVLIPVVISESRAARRIRNQRAIDNATRHEHRPGGLENWR